MLILIPSSLAAGYALGFGLLIHFGVIGGGIPGAWLLFHYSFFSTILLMCFCVSMGARTAERIGVSMRRRRSDSE